MLKVKRSNIIIPCEYNKNHFLSDENTVFFDIETTGFSSINSTLYLIGCIHEVDGNYFAIQWLAEDSSEESLIIHEFFNYINSFSSIVHFNGDGFDIPYLEAKCKKFMLPYTFSKYNSFDLYKKINKLKHILKIENLKQKTIENYLELSRTEKYSGGELISVYQDYTVNNDERLAEMLLKHNLDDISGMVSILDILSYTYLFDGNYKIDNIEYTDKNEILFNIALPYTLPKRLTYGFGPFYMSSFENLVYLKIKMYTDELKFFYPNYSDYYYLPVEDISIHKCISFYVDKNFRTKAKAANCYSKKTGRFLPQYKEIISPYFKIDYHDKITYFEIIDEFLNNENLVKGYTMHILNLMLSRKS